MSSDAAAGATDEVAAADSAAKPETIDSPPPTKPDGALTAPNSGTESAIPLTAELLEAYGYRLPYAYHYAGYIWPGLLFSAERLAELKGFRFRSSDVLIVSYPKSGTTWVSELVSLLVNRGDTSVVLKSTLHERVPWLELDQKNFWVWFFTVWQGIVKLIGLPNMSIGTNIDVDQGNRVVGSSVDEPEGAQGDDAAAGGPPRVFFTHLPLELLPRHVLDGGCRIIYVARNPKDTAVSFFHFHQMARFLGQQTTSWEEFFPLFANGKVYSGSWFEHVTSYWEFCKFNKNMLFVKYEDLKRDLAEQVGVLCAFLGTPLEPAAVADVVAHCSFKKMQDNKLVNREGIWLFNHKISRFMRKGIVGDWKNYFTVAQNSAFDAVVGSKLAECGLEFDYDQEGEDANVSVLESESSSSSSDGDGSSSSDESEGEKCSESDEESEVEGEKAGSEEETVEKGDKSRSESEASNDGDSDEEKEQNESKEGENIGVDGKAKGEEEGSDEDDSGEESGGEQAGEQGSGDEKEEVVGVNGGERSEETGSFGDVDKSDILANINLSRGEPDNVEDDKQRNFDDMQGGDGMDSKNDGVKVMELRNDQTN